MNQTRNRTLLLSHRLFLLLLCGLLAACAEQPPRHPDVWLRLGHPIQGVVREKGELTQDALYDVGLYHHRLRPIVRGWYDALYTELGQMAPGTAQVVFFVNADSQVEDVKATSQTSPANKALAASMERLIRSTALPPLPASVARALRQHHDRQPMKLEARRK